MENAVDRFRKILSAIKIRIFLWGAKNHGSITKNFIKSPTLNPI